MGSNAAAGLCSEEETKDPRRFSFDAELTFFPNQETLAQAHRPAKNWTSEDASFGATVGSISDRDEHTVIGQAIPETKAGFVPATTISLPHTSSQGDMYQSLHSQPYKRAATRSSSSDKTTSSSTIGQSFSPRTSSRQSSTTVLNGSHHSRTGSTFAAPFVSQDLTRQSFTTSTVPSVEPSWRASSPTQDTVTSNNVPDSVSPPVDRATISNPTFRSQIQQRKPHSSGREHANRSTRESAKSSVTNGSSAPENSSTERSSVWTSRTSTSDVGLEEPDPPWLKNRAISMAVEDVVGMYENGFEDSADESSPRSTPKNFASSPLVSRPQSQEQLHKDPSLDALAHGQPKFLTPALASPTVRDSTEILLAQPTTAYSPQQRSHPRTYIQRDRYGFKKCSQHVTLEQYNTWNRDYQDYAERRYRKWVSLMSQHSLSITNPTRFPPRNEKTKRYVRKGIPPEWRGAAWFYYAGGPARLGEYPDLYARLAERADQGRLPEADKEHIERDLHRTFPDNDKFKPDGLRELADNSIPSSADTPQIVIDPQIISSLRRVLRAFAIHNPQVGYCQSLNFLAGNLLLFLYGDEEKAFHLLCILTSVHLPGTHGVALEGANIDIGVLMVCLEEYMPQLWAKLDDRVDTSVPISAGDMRSTKVIMKSLESMRKGSSITPPLPANGAAATGSLPTISLATTAWFMSCFASTLPIETCARVWDLLFYEGSKTLFRVALAIFRMGERDIRRCGDAIEAFQVVQTLPRGLLDANSLIENATRTGKGGCGNLKQKTIDKRREERKALYHQGKEGRLTPVKSVNKAPTLQRKQTRGYNDLKIGIQNRVVERPRTTGDSVDDEVDAGLKRTLSRKGLGTIKKSDITRPTTSGLSLKVPDVPTSFNMLSDQNLPNSSGARTPTSAVSGGRTPVSAMSDPSVTTSPGGAEEDNDHNRESASSGSKLRRTLSRSVSRARLRKSKSKKGHDSNPATPQDEQLPHPLPQTQHQSLN